MLEGIQHCCRCGLVATREDRLNYKRQEAPTERESGMYVCVCARVCMCVCVYYC